MHVDVDDGGRHGQRHEHPRAGAGRQQPRIGRVDGTPERPALDKAAIDKRDKDGFAGALAGFGREPVPGDRPCPKDPRMELLLDAHLKHR